MNLNEPTDAQLFKKQLEITLEQMAKVERSDWEVRFLRAALKELILWHRADGDCWCGFAGGHSKGCLMAKEALRK